MGLLVYYSSATGNTHSFVSRLKQRALRVEKGQRDLKIKERYVLVIPTYADCNGVGSVPKPLIHLLNDPENRVYLRGVIASGNRNFGTMFAIGGREVAHKCAVPCLYKFELRGTDEDVERVTRGLELFWKHKY